MRHFTKAIIIASAVLAASTLPSMADDDRRCGNIPRAEWMSVEEIARKATALGYQVSSVDSDDGCWEVEARDRDGRRVDVHFQPVTADVVYTDFDD
jgi:hypothetical protein